MKLVSPGWSVWIYILEFELLDVDSEINVIVLTVLDTLDSKQQRPYSNLSCNDKIFRYTRPLFLVHFLATLLEKNNNNKKKQRTRQH